jgi:hypothetical protein
MPNLISFLTSTPFRETAHTALVSHDSKKRSKCWDNEFLRLLLKQFRFKKQFFSPRSGFGWRRDVEPNDGLPNDNFGEKRTLGSAV